MLFNSILPYLGRVLRNLHLDLKSTCWQKNNPETNRIESGSFLSNGKTKIVKRISNNNIFSFHFVYELSFILFSTL